MEEVNEETNPRSGPGGDPGAGPSHGENNSTPGPVKWGEMVKLISSRKIDTALWATRLITITCSFLYFLPILGGPTNFYYKAFLANAATSALRLHQRVPTIQFNRIFFTQLLLEDSCHYLFYSLIFIYCSPITLAVIPIFIFALLHFSSFSLTLVDALGQNSSWIGRMLISLIEHQTITMLRMAAGAEIFTMQFAIMYALMGQASLITPFVYYRFLTLRYVSRRNHYNRTMFRELRMLCEHFASSPKCPGIISRIISRSISIISRFAPETQAAN